MAPYLINFMILVCLVGLIIQLLSLSRFMDQNYS